MCGIAGFYSLSNRFSETDLRLMCDRIAHRGPDADGIINLGPVGLGHRRLSIIDLSDVANQPMTSGDGRYVLVYNGESYNFNEIAQNNFGEDERSRFRSKSDTEVILEGFARIGPAFLDQMIGMFAFAFYDKQKQELHIVRDRMGIKPLYYYWDGKDLAFASELKALQSIKHLDLRVRKKSIQNFLHLGYIPAPFSIYKNVYKLQSGCYLKIDKNGIQNNNYWKLEDKISDNVISDESNALLQLGELIKSSVSYRMYSDVPLGVFLSGGIDSSVVAATAAQLSDQKVKTYSIGFRENEHDESQYARRVANHLGTEHHEFIVTIDEAKQLLPKMASYFDEPFADSSAIPTMLVSKLARQHVKVTLSGDGGDELFFGYGAHVWAQRLQKQHYKLLHKPASALFSKMSDRYRRVAGLLDYDKETNLASHIFSQEQYLFSNKEIESLCAFSQDDARAHDPAAWGVDCREKMEYQNTGVARQLLPEEQQALFDLNYYLQDDLLVKVDRSSMLYSLETRVPLLDHRLVEFALNLDPSLKLKNKSSKYLLKKYLYTMVPEEYFDRPKRGFSIPLHKWLNGELSYLVDDYLNEALIKNAGFVNYQKVEQLITDYRSGQKYLYNRVWQLIVLHQWYKENSKINRSVQASS